MSTASQPSSDIAFTPAVKAVQRRRHSRELYANVEANGGFRTAIDEDLVLFLAAGVLKQRLDEQGAAL